MKDYSYKILNCKEYRDLKEVGIAKYILENSLKLRLVIIQVGDDFASNSYINNKLKACERCRIESELIKLDEKVSQDELLKIIHRLNESDNVTGIIVQFPLPAHIDSQVINDSILYTKDVDGFSIINKGKLYSNKDCLIPCTAQGVIEILKHNDLDIDGKNVAIINRSDLVGKPLMHLFLQNNATVTVCHSHTNNLKEICLKSDIIVIGIGQPNFLKSDFIKEDAVILDVGINFLDDKLCGDVDFFDCIEKCSKITTVPGGVGLLTVTNLLSNVVKAHSIQAN
ncbi:bifunctional 5,10-methylenetetrahydrofolate dehydrogenase/5,10-methenyltetrahydrofolate cyclohydrolase [Candidatus Arthromitus sp. SFB-rat-Yit]|uniref:bifunctional 5,10-methylenetetrahydrofolate dehydrogenase/5,10-methenyltetrahydrofolate cyclohydrolase n=1 Tax=Candidatus Arthromitus sp. SFB-rat-Yit TaxID=1041504 RepID=UPI000227A176|nr:bifunctional 5,10-methylenetetrahydrofolate dehydrogenase/5,10-methenyltetrahydrofolate cyclohydrolase [Candidatus Arthromitus sp. SFB-rat-Yit]BAK81300.1 methylenetetrahydrofolate dehydrogenase (NADP(+)) [Candidatus Arthromitus sp. SFB-rat-Yit]